MVVMVRNWQSKGLKGNLIKGLGVPVIAQTCCQLRSGAEGLKASQQYPPKYGLQMASLHREYTATTSALDICG